MEMLTTVDIVGAWISIFLTISVLSFLYDDNPIYKITEHLFMGVSIGYGVTEAFWNVLRPNLYDKLMSGEMLYLIPLGLCILLMFKISRKNSWLARIPIAFLVAAYAAVKVTGEASGKLVTQVAESMPNLQQDWQANQYWNWEADGAGIVSSALLVLGLMACLIHFYFSKVPEKLQRFGVPFAGVVMLIVFSIVFADLSIANAGARFTIALLVALCAALPCLILSPYKPLVSRFGVFVLMLSFGASFGFTVMGRISLAIGRAQHLLGKDLSVEKAAQINPQAASLVSLAIVIGFIILYKRGKKPIEKAA